MSDDREKLAMSGLKNVQDLIVARRRVWHSEHDYTATCKEVVDRSEYRATPWISVYGFIGLASPLSYFLPILTAVEVREQPVGAVLVDTLAGDDCEMRTMGEIIVKETGEHVMWSQHPDTRDRDLENRFALKTLPTEEA